jgi:3-deoxy-manno-octulosonate cytidylyltransferase (CMP-KDO synthetase)
MQACALEDYLDLNSLLLNNHFCWNLQLKKAGVSHVNAKRNLKVAAFIPCRMGSSRFPGKPVVEILGLPMIEHIRRRVEKMSFINETYVATCDQNIRELVESFGGKVIMTADSHRGATDRVAEACLSTDADIVINVQGDEPMVLDSHLKLLVDSFADGRAKECVNLVYPIRDASELTNPNIVKVVTSRSNKILYFTRASIPSREYDPQFQYLKQSGLMAFTKQAILDYAAAKPTPLEVKESVDLLRLLENDKQIEAVYCDYESKGVDAPGDIREVETAIMTDPLQRSLYESIRSL